MKVRLGWDCTSQAFEIADAVQQGGATEITIHGRTKADGYRADRINWEKIGEVRSRLTIPVIANGEIWRWEDGQACLKATGCEDLMVGRGALNIPNLSLVLKQNCEKNALGGYSKNLAKICGNGKISMIPVFIMLPGSNNGYAILIKNILKQISFLNELKPAKLQKILEKDSIRAKKSAVKIDGFFSITPTRTMSAYTQTKLDQIKKLSYRISRIDEAYTTKKERCLMKTRLLLSSLLIALSASSLPKRIKRIGLIMEKKALNIGVICSPNIKPVS